MEASQSCQLRQRTQCSGPGYATQSTWSKADASTSFNLSPNIYLSTIYLYLISIMYIYFIIYLHIWSLLISDPCMCSWFEWLEFRTRLATWRGSSWKVPVFGNWKPIVQNTLQTYLSLDFNTLGTCMLLPGHLLSQNSSESFHLSIWL